MLEKHLQQQIVAYCAYKKILCFSVPNGIKLGGINNFKYLSSLKKQGFLVGVSDLIILTKKHTFLVELKVKNGKQSPAQKNFENQIKELANNNISYHVITSLESFIALIS